MPEVVVPLLTPFHRPVDEGALAEHVDCVIAKGVDSLMSWRTTGEGPLLEPADVDGVVA
jgi:dihydrodipicolinate synthase/N-acetylneuraminate lyase